MSASAFLRAFVNAALRRLVGTIGTDFIVDRQRTKMRLEKGHFKRFTVPSKVQ